MKRLIVFRHAKSDWDADYGSDHDRPLNTRGEKAARAMGIVLARCGEVPQYAFTSSARRARTTLELAIEAGGWDTDVEITDALYGTSARGALQVAAAAPDHTKRLMIVGHQPTWGDVVHHLTGGRVQVKTATVVGIDLQTPTWRTAEEAPGSVAYVLAPRLFTDGDWRLA